jgi:hypothetical protein
LNDYPEHPQQALFLEAEALLHSCLMESLFLKDYIVPYVIYSLFLTHPRPVVCTDPSLNLVDQSWPFIITSDEGQT